MLVCRWRACDEVGIKIHLCGKEKLEEEVHCLCQMCARTEVCLQ